MRSGTSFFNGTVWKKTFLRFWPIWAADLTLWALSLPLRGLMAIQSQNEYGGSYVADFVYGLGEFGQVTALMFAVIFGLLAAMAVCSHLYSSRSANFMGALPVRREGMFLSVYLAGLAMLILPALAVFFLTVIVELAAGLLAWVPLLYWLGSLCGMCVFFYSFAVFLGMFAGHLLALPVFYGVFNFLAMSGYILWSYIMSTFYYGYDQAGIPAVIEWCTPTLWLYQNLSYWANYPVSVWQGAGVPTYTCGGLASVAVYAAVGLVLAALAMLLYRRRQMESAGDVVAVRVMRPVFKYGVALCAGMFFGFLTSAVLGGEEGALMAAILLWGVAGYFVAQMILDKSFRVFRKWKGAAAVTAVFVVLFLVVGFDLTGYETRVPAAGSVKSVQVQGLDSTPYDGASWLNIELSDPAAIEKITALHQAAVEHRELTPEQLVSGETEYWSLDLVYTLENGGTLARHYLLEGWSGDADTQGTVYWAVQQVLSDRDIVWQAYGFDRIEEAMLGRGRMTVDYQDESGVLGEKYPESSSVEEEDGPATETVSTATDAAYYVEADALLLWDAVVADFQAGNIGVRQIQEDHEPRTLDFLWTPDRQEMDRFESALNALTLQIAVPDTAEQTLAALEALGAVVR